MSDVPLLSYVQIINTLKRLGFIVVRQKGSHIRLHKRVYDKALKLTVPAHKPVRPNTLRQILKQGEITLDEFKDAL